MNKVYVSKQSCRQNTGKVEGRRHGRTMTDFDCKEADVGQLKKNMAPTAENIFLKIRAGF
jgi:hypothetical protein